MTYLIFRCQSCRKINIAEVNQRTKLCAFCGKRNRLGKIIPLAKAASPREAKKIASKLKTRNGKPARTSPRPETSPRNYLM